MSIGEKLKEWRATRDIGQKEASAIFGVSYSVYQKYELGSSVPGGDAIKAFVRAGINANWLLTGEGDMLLPADKGEIPPDSTSPAIPGAALKDVLKDKTREQASDDGVNPEDWEDWEDWEDRLAATKDEPPPDQQTLARLHGQSMASYDFRLFGYLIETVESALRSRQLTLEPSRKSVFMQLLYEYCNATGSRSPRTVDRFLKLIE